MERAPCSYFGTFKNALKTPLSRSASPFLSRGRKICKADRSRIERNKIARRITEFSVFFPSGFGPITRKCPFNRLKKSETFAVGCFLARELNFFLLVVVPPAKTKIERPIG